MGRSIVNLAGLAAVLLCAASVAMWLRSQYADDAWVLPARPLTNPPPSYGQAAWELNRVVGSTNGRLVCLEYEEPQYSPYKWSEGYCPPPVPQRILDKSTYLAPPYPAGMERGALPGVEWVSMPYQVV